MMQQHMRRGPMVSYKTKVEPLGLVEGYRKTCLRHLHRERGLSLRLKSANANYATLIRTHLHNFTQHMP